jgi:hypothetical protein
VVLAGGVLAIYLGAAHSQAPPAPVHPHPPLAVKVASVQTAGVVDFGVYDDGDAWQNDADDHPMMLLKKGSAISFALVPQSQLGTGTPQWTVDQLTDGGYIFIYLPTGQCLTAASSGRLSLTHCDLSSDQRWRQLHSRVVLTEPITQYASVTTGGCLTAGHGPGLATLTTCAVPGTKLFKTQEIALWWSA